MKLLNCSFSLLLSNEILKVSKFHELSLPFRNRRAHIQKICYFILFKFLRLLDTKSFTSLG